MASNDSMDIGFYDEALYLSNGLKIPDSGMGPVVFAMVSDRTQSSQRKEHNG